MLVDILAETQGVPTLHMKGMREKGAIYLFESARKYKYTDRGVRKMLARYAQAAGITHSMSPHKWRHFLFTWLKKEGIDDALIQPYSGHTTRQSLEIYSRLSLADAQPSYNQAMEHFYKSQCIIDPGRPSKN